MNENEVRGIYDRRYARGDGFRYKRANETASLRKLVLGPADPPAGGRICEIGSGEGLHAFVLSRLGFDVDAVDFSEVAIAHARALHPGPAYHAQDAAGWLATHVDAYDLVFARGISWFHYELDGTNSVGVKPRDLFSLMYAAAKPGGAVALQMATDLSGRFEGAGHVRQNAPADFVGLASAVPGSLVALTDWRGRDITPPAPVRSKAGGAVLIVRKPAE